MTTTPTVDAGIRVPFHVTPINDGDIAAVIQVLRNGWITTGPQCAAFERAFGRLFSEDTHAVAVNSGTAALHLALEAVGVGSGDLVITSTYTFTATAEVVRYLGADPVLADVDPTTGNLTVDTVRAAYAALPPAARSRVRAIVPVHFAGLPCDMSALSGLADEYGAAMVDDAAHALPASHAGRAIGRYGDATAFSFYATKTLSTGEGGMVVTRRPELARRMGVMRLHGIDRPAFDRYTAANKWQYQVVAPGFKYNMTDLAAALGLSQLVRLFEHREQRARIAAEYTAHFAGVAGLRPPPDRVGPDEHAWHLYSLRVADGPAVRDALIEELAHEGVMTSMHFIPLHRHPYYRDRYGLEDAAFPGASLLADQEISLPLFPGMSEAQTAKVVTAVPAALARAHRRAGHRG